MAGTFEPMPRRYAASCPRWCTLWVLAMPRNSAAGFSIMPKNEIDLARSPAAIACTAFSFSGNVFS